MNKIRIILPTFIVLFFLASVSLTVFAKMENEMANLPYDSLFQLHEIYSKKLPKDKPFWLHLSSTNPKVESSDIILHLISKDEKIKIPIDNCGYIDLPVRKDLVGIGAFVVTNQPKGTMVLRGKTKSQITLQNRAISYKDLMSGVLISKSAEKIAQNIPEIEAEKYIKSLHLVINQDVRKPVIIRLRNGKTVELIPDDFGNVLVPFEENLIETNPMVEFPCDEVFFITNWK